MNDNEEDYKIYQPFDWKIQDGQDGSNMEIRCYALSKDSKPGLIRIKDFPVYAFLELPLFIGTKAKRWNLRKAKNFLNDLIEVGGFNREENEIHKPKETTFYEAKRKCYYYRGKYRVPMMRLEWGTMKSMWRWKSFLSNPVKVPAGHVKVELHETKINVIQKFLTALSMRHCQWFKFEGETLPEEDRISNYENEFLIEAGDIEPIPLEESTSWKTCPMLASWDIETYSDRHKAMPDKYNYNHVVYLITLTLQRLGDTNKKRYAFILGDSNDIPEEQLEDVIIVICESETSLIKEFSETIVKEDPQIVMGYNIFSYDFPYLDHRLKRMNKTWPNMSVLKDNNSDMININWSSGAFGENDINYIPMDGRVNVDLIHVVKRRFKMELYNLDAVGKKFTGKTKLDMPAAEMFRRYELMQRTREALIKKLYKDGHLKKYTSLNKALNITVKDLYKHIDKITDSSEYKGYQVALDKRSEVVLYAIQDTEIPLKIFEKLSVWVELIETASIVCATPEQLFTEGQQKKCINKFYYSCAKKNVVFDEREINCDKFGGGFVFEPEPGLHKGVIALDFKSMYPSIVMAYNICLSTLVPPELYHDVPDEECHLFDIDLMEDDDDDEEEDAFDDTVKKYKNKQIKQKFKFYKMEEGILPGIVRELIDERDAVRKVQKKYKKGCLEWSVLEARQLALKVMANSYFGALGARNGGKMPLPEGAMAITQTGRNLILMVNDRLIKEYGARIIYNDTDSTMINMGTEDNAETYKLGLKLAAIINGDELKDKKTDEIIVPKGKSWFISPIRIEFEKAMLMLCICKKKYAALLINEDGSFEMEDELDEDGNVIGQHLEILIRGIVLARRDNCKCLKRIFRHILEAILTGKDFEYCMHYLIDSVNEILDGKLPLEEFTSTRKLGASYKSESYFMKVFADRIRAAGKIANPGDRLQFVVCVVDKVKALMGDRMFLLDQFYEGGLKLDYIYYIEKVLMNPLDQLISTGYKNVIKQLPTLYYKPKNKRHVITIEEPLKLIFHFIQAGKKIDHLKTIITEKIKELNEGKVEKYTELEVEETITKPVKYTVGKNKEIPEHILDLKKRRTVLVVEEEQDGSTELVIEDDEDEKEEKKEKDKEEEKEDKRIVHKSIRTPKMGEANRSRRIDIIIPNVKGNSKIKHKMLPKDWQDYRMIRERKLLMNWENVLNRGMGCAY